MGATPQPCETAFVSAVGPCTAALCTARLPRPTRSVHPSIHTYVRLPTHVNAYIATDTRAFRRMHLHPNQPTNKQTNKTWFACVVVNYVCLGETRERRRIGLKGRLLHLPAHTSRIHNKQYELLRPYARTHVPETASSPSLTRLE